MRPILFKLGAFPVFSWGLSLSLAIILGVILTTRLAKKINIDSDTILDFAIWLVVGGVAGARLFYVFVYDPAFYLRNPLQILALWNGGMVYYGALMGGFLTGVYFVVKRKLPFWELADLVSPALALGYGIVRIGCFMNGCCYGKPVESGWGLIFPFIDGVPSLEHIARYPTQIYSSVFGYLLFGLLLYLWKHRKFTGQIFLTFMILYAIERTIVEAFRENLLVFDSVTISQLVSAIVIVPAIYFYWKRSRVPK